MEGRAALKQALRLAYAVILVASSLLMEDDIGICHHVLTTLSRSVDAVLQTGARSNGCCW